MGSRDPLLEFFDPLIYRERLKLETSNLAQRWTAVSVNKKCKIMLNGVMWVSRDLLLEFCDPVCISGTIEARNFKFGVEIDDNEY